MSNANNKMDVSLEKFLSSELDQLASGIDLNPVDVLPRKSEDFVEQIWKDDQGNSIENAEVHNSIHKFIRKARRKGYNKILVLGAFGHGKSFSGTTGILLYDGSVKKAKDIRVGDLLMGDDGTPRKVLFLGNGKEEMYKVTLKNKDSFVCNKSHVLACIMSNRYSGFQKGEKINVHLDEYLELPNFAKKNCVKQYKVPLNFEHKDVWFDPYIYGVWLGDGDKNSLIFTINDSDIQIVKELCLWAKKNDLKFDILPLDAHCNRYKIRSKKYGSYKELTFIQDSFVNEEKRINKEYLINSKEVRLELLAGLIDTDGYLFDKCYEFVTKYIGLRDDVLFLCRSLGFSVTHHTKYVNDVPYYRIFVSGDTHLIPCKTRKKAGKREQIKNPLIYGFKVEPVGEGEYFGFGVDGNHLFLLEDFTVVHNTEQILGYILFQIAKNPNLLVKVVHISDTEAINRVRTLAEHIKSNENFKAMCPHVVPTHIWGQEKFIVKRKSLSKDPTCQAFSVLSSSLGGRAHIVYFDDINDLKSAVLEPKTRVNVEKTVRNVWETRVIPGKSLILATLNKWHNEDISSYMVNNPTWAWMSVEVAEDKESLIYKDCFNKTRHMPIWDKFPKHELEDRHLSMGDRDYNRGFRLIPYTDADRTFPNFESCCKYGIRPSDMIGDLRDWVFAAGVDFANIKREGTVLTVGALNKITGLKIPVECHLFTKPSDLAEAMVDTWQRFGIELFLCENNAVQGAIIDLIRSYLDSRNYRRYNMKIEGFYTGKNKADPLQGLPSINREMENGEWLFCFPKQYYTSEEGIRDVWCRMYYELRDHPFYITSDITMSIWFIREAFKKIMQKSDNLMIY